MINGGVGPWDENINSHGKHYSRVSCAKEGDSAALIRQMCVYHRLPLIILTGKEKAAWLAWVTCVCVCLCVGVVTQSSVHLASGLTLSWSPCLVNHASFTLSLGLSVGVCRWVSWPVGFLPAALTTPCTPLYFPPLKPTWLIYLDHPCCLLPPGTQRCAKQGLYSLGFVDRRLALEGRRKK